MCVCLKKWEKKSHITVVNVALFMGMRLSGETHWLHFMAWFAMMLASMTRANCLGLFDTEPCSEYQAEVIAEDEHKDDREQVLCAFIWLKWHWH